MAGIIAPDGKPYMSVAEMKAIEDRCSFSSVVPWGRKYPPGEGVSARDGFDAITPDGQSLADCNQNILSLSIAGHAKEVDRAVEDTRLRFPRLTLVDSTRFFEPAALLKQELHDAFSPYGDYLIQLAATGTGANEQAIRAAMGSLGGPKNSQLLVLANNYGGAGLHMNSICEAVGWRGDTSLESNADVVYLDGSNLDDIFALCAFEGKKPILIMEDGVQGVGGFNVLDEKFLRELVERVSDAGGRKIYDNVQTFVRASGGKGLFGFNRWADPENPKHLPDFVTLAKGLGDGYGQAAIAAKKSVLEEIKLPGNTFDTFNQLRDALASSRTVLNVSQREKLYQNVHERGAQFQENLRPMVDRFPGVVSRVVGIGGMTGLEFRDADKLLSAMRHSVSSGLFVAKGGPVKGSDDEKTEGPVMRLPLQFDTIEAFVERVSGCVEDMLRRVQEETGA